MNHSITPAQKFKAIIFDLDGTLVNSFPPLFRFFNQVLLEMKGRTFGIEELAPYFGPPEHIVFKELFPDQDECQRAVDRYYELMRGAGSAMTAFDGVPEVIAGLRDQSRHLAVYSMAATEAARIRLQLTGLLDSFSEVRGGDMVTRWKPDPEGVIHLIEHFNVAAHEAVYIGDMASDVAAGKGAGAATIAVTWGAGKRAALEAAQPDFLIDDPKELIGILE